MIPLCSRFDSLAFTSDPFPIGGEINFSRSPKEYEALVKKVGEMFDETGCVPDIDGEEVLS